MTPFELVTAIVVGLVIGLPLGAIGWAAVTVIGTLFVEAVEAFRMRLLVRKWRKQDYRLRVEAGRKTMPKDFRIR